MSDIFSKARLMMTRKRGYIPLKIWNRLVGVVYSMAITSVVGGRLERHKDGTALIIDRVSSGGGGSAATCNQLKPSIVNTAGGVGTPIWEMFISNGAFQPHVPEISDGGPTLDSMPVPSVLLPALPSNLYAVTVWEATALGNVVDGYTMQADNVRTYFIFATSPPAEIIPEVDAVTGATTDGLQVEWWATIHEDGGVPYILDEPECGTCQPQFCEAGGFFQLKFNRT